MPEHGSAEHQVRTEASFRDVNEKLANGLHRRHRRGSDVAGFICECGHADCADLVHVEMDIYTEVREDDRRFLINPAHVISDLEEVVELSDHHAVVEKREEFAHLVDRSV